MLGSGFKKDNINAKLKSELNKWLTLDFNARLSYSTIEGLSGGADTNESNAANSTVANAVVSVRSMLCLIVRMMMRRAMLLYRKRLWNVCWQRIKDAILSVRIIISV